MLTISPIPIFEDNYVWVFETSSDDCVFVVDPGDAKPVLSYLETHSKSLQGILITHHHWDHISGIAELLTHFNVPVYGPAEGSVKEITHPVRESESVVIDDKIHFDVLETPGHTLDHLTYIYQDDSQCQVFCGDTLFAGGCGRLFEGSPAMMWQSLNKLIQLPSTTQFFCTHEYTLANLAFAKAVEPDNYLIEQRIAEVNQQREAGQPSVPTTLELELNTNPFLRCHLESVRNSASKYAKRPMDTAEDVFTAIRGWKDVF